MMTNKRLIGQVHTCEQSVLPADTNIHRSAIIVEVAALVRSVQSTPLQQKLICKYQTSLDNELCRAIRALRETQEWRLQTLDNGAPHGSTPRRD
ncbi:hypothetical protein [Cupriavidus sp. IK-TO18]|uniref:hypothetical protein n=1 Tax=Cupriavidus sp. IK-TO18 TaxID=2782182 RepID=UPI00189A3354|nr:hypothetical protein [Cupriavidus sp. IK-TO18]MBF6986745.1 hypothetical protein [Cupriavidus sp. IK-TO18]